MTGKAVTSGRIGGSRLSERLTTSGRQVWVDVQDIPPSARWRAEIHAAIEASEAFVFVASPASLSSDICIEELGHAFALNKRVLPVVIAEIDHHDAPPDLAALNWLHFGKPTTSSGPSRRWLSLSTRTWRGSRPIPGL